MRIALVTPGASDRRANSGIPYYMARALGRRAEVVPIEPPRSPLRSIAGLGARANRRLFGSSYLPEFSLLAATGQALRIGRALARVRPDVVFAPFASAQAAMLRSRFPIIYSSDTTFHLMRDYYPSFSGMSRLSGWEGETLERATVQRAAALVYPSAWAAASAMRDYGAAAASILIAPYGANLDDEPDRERALIADRGATCSLCFVGVNWVRKGGSVAVETLHALRARGVPAHLTVVGCEPPPGVDRSHLTVVPRVDKSNPAHRQMLSALYSASYFLILPTRADCSPIVCCEASAHGTPVLITDTGGVAGHVTAGVNGYLMPPGADAAPYVDTIVRLWGDRNAYQALVTTTRREFERRLNWDAWAGTVVDHIYGVVSDAPRKMSAL